MPVKDVEDDVADEFPDGAVDNDTVPAEDKA